MTIPDRSDALMHHLRDRAEAAGEAIEDAAARVWADPAQLARLIDEAHMPYALYWPVLKALTPAAYAAGEAPTPAALAEGIDAGRLDALPADVRARLERYVTERCAERLGL